MMDIRKIRCTVPCDPMTAKKGCHCAEAREEIERLRAALEEWQDAVRIDVLMEGPRYMGVEPSRGRRAWENGRAALEDGNG